MNATRSFVVSTLPCFVALHAAVGFLILGAGVCRAADDEFHGDSMPEPPAQHDKWTPPDGSQKELAEAARILFDQGMADPRGLEYRQIKVATGNVWGNFDGHNSTMTAEVLQTHGWVLPAHAGIAQRFAVCWNGLVYPVLAVGEPCDLEKDVEAQLKPPPDKQDGFMRRMQTYMSAPDEAAGVAFDMPLPLKSMLLLRLGKADLAAKVWQASYTDPGSPDRKPPSAQADIYQRLATMWLFSFYDRAICAWMRRDDDLALVTFRQLAPLTPIVKKTYDGLPDTQKLPMSGEAFDFLNQVPIYLADMERRHKEAPHKPALELGRDKFPDKAAWIKALIEDLEDVYVPQDGQPGWPMLDQSATVQALVKEGNDAVEPLLDCLEHDNRYARTVHFWRDFAPNRSMISSYEAAYTALRMIFQTNFFDIRSSGQDLTNSGPEARAKVVAAIRAYWQKRKGTPQEDQWLTTLGDDNAKPEEWAEAAANIVKSTFSFSDEKKPKVTALLEKRISALSQQELGPAFRRPPVLELMESLLNWDANETGYMRGVCNAMVAQYVKQKDASSYFVDGMVRLAERMIAEGDTKVLADYAGWLRTIPPDKITFGFGGFAKSAWFKLLYKHQDDETMQKTAEYLFTDNDSPWLRYIRGNPAANETLDLLRSPLVGVPAFRNMLLSELAQKTPAGASGYLETDFWIARFGDPKNGTQVMAGLNPLDPLSKNPPRNSPFLTCDFYAWALSGVVGMPVLEFYWPREKRDTAVQAAIHTLEKYGARYNVTPNNPGEPDYRHGPDGIAAQLWFPRLDHPAVEADVQNGTAIFALPAAAKPRLWPMPQYPLKARWTALKDFSENAGYGDEMGRHSVKTEFKNEGRIWQAEEGFIDGKWRRFFGFAGSHHIERVPAEEIEFPAKWPWQELSNGFDCQIADDGVVSAQKPLKPGESLPITIKLRNRRGIDQKAPSTLYKPGIKSFAAGVDIHLYRKIATAPGEIVKETGDKKTTKSNAAPGWTELPPKMKKIAHFDAPEPAQKLAPMDEIQAASCTLGDFYDFSAPGDYYIEITFDPAKTKFAGGTTNYIKFRVGEPGAAAAGQPVTHD